MSRALLMDRAAYHRPKLSHLHHLTLNHDRQLPPMLSRYSESDSNTTHESSIEGETFPPSQLSQTAHFIQNHNKPDASGQSEPLVKSPYRTGLSPGSQSMSTPSLPACCTLGSPLLGLKQSKVYLQMYLQRTENKPKEAAGWAEAQG